MVTRFATILFSAIIILFTYNNCAPFSAANGIASSSQFSASNPGGSLGGESPYPPPTTTPTASVTPAPVATPPSSSPAPTPVAGNTSIISAPANPGPKTTINPDALLNTCFATTANGGDVIGLQTQAAPLTGVTQGLIMANHWRADGGQGQTSINYSGQGSLSMNVNFHGMSNFPVNGYPFIGYGAGVFNSNLHGGDFPGTPQFPVRLSAMKSLTVETIHSLSVTSMPMNLDIAFDEWLVPTAPYPSTPDQIKYPPGGAVEVMLMYYYNFQERNGCDTSNDKVFTAPVILAGQSKQLQFREIVCKNGSGPGSYVAFVPINNAANLSSAHIRVNFLDFMKEGAAASGVGNDWYLTGVQFGSEYGNSSAATYSLNLTQFQIEQTLN